jgi:hypothetical protein
MKEQLRAMQWVPGKEHERAPTKVLNLATVKAHCLVANLEWTKEQVWVESWVKR